MRKQLVEVFFASEKQTFDAKFFEVETFLQRKTLCGETHLRELRQALKNFKHQFKIKWERSNRTKKLFLASEIKWLNGSIAFKKFSSPAGRPYRFNFETCSESSKRKRTAELRNTVPTNELVYAAQMSLRASGQKQAADLVKEATTSQSFLQRLTSFEEPRKVSSLEALSMMIEAKLSRHQYNIIRTYAKSVFPSYKEVQKEKKNCYPSEIKITETCAEVPMQNLLDHTSEKILINQINVLEFFQSDTENELKLVSKWGFDGSSGHSQYHQKYLESHESDDKFIFMKCLVPLQLSFNQKVLWKNPCPSSPRYSRPLKIEFQKESDELVRIEKDITDTQIKNLHGSNITIDNKKFVVKHETILSMIDGKLCNSLSDTKSSMRCYLCNATCKEFNNVDKMVQLLVSEQYLSFGLSVLHAWIRLFECLLHVAYKLPVQEWRASKTTEVAVNENKKRIQREVKEKLGLIVDHPKPGYGNTNTGNVARRFFEKSNLSATITGIDELLIQKFYIILQCLSSGFKLNYEKFKSYCEDTARYFVTLYPWYYMSTTVHKILIHGHLIASSCLLPIGQLSEEALESRNKDFKIFREQFSRKTSRKDNLTDIFNRMMISSDPLLSSLKSQNLFVNKKDFHSDAIDMFDVGTISTENE